MVNGLTPDGVDTTSEESIEIKLRKKVGIEKYREKYSLYSYPISSLEDFPASGDK